MKKAIIIASCLLAAGLLVCFAAIALINFDFRKLDNNMYITNTYEFTENINNVYIDINTADIDILASEDNTAKIVCLERDNRKHAVNLSDGTLKIERENKEWYKNIDFFSFKTPKITLYLPQKDYESLTVECTTGNITIKNTNATELTLTASTGDTYLNNINVSDLKAKLTTGDIILKNVIADNTELTATTGDITLTDSRSKTQLNAKLTTGDIKFENSDAGDIYCKSTTGDITGTLLSNKIFYTDTTTGNVEVPQSTKGGVCELKTTTGSIKLSVVLE